MKTSRRSPALNFEAPPDDTSRRMKRVRSKSTAPELFVRSTLWRLGVRYRLHRRDLPGKPDIFVSRLRLAIFVNGCFWHGHHCVKGRRLPRVNTEAWRAKRDYNSRRDLETYAKLTQMGICVRVIWECELSQSVALLRRIACENAMEGESLGAAKTQGPSN